MSMDRQPHRIIVEGMDGAGKTTLIDELQLHFPGLQRIVRPQGRPLNDWWPEEMDRQRIDPVPIYDRFFYSELVYGPILRGKFEPDLVLINNVAWFLRSVAFLIYVRPHSSVIRENVRESQQMVGVKDNFSELLEAYDNVMEVEKQWYKDRFFHYDWRKPGDDFTLQSALRKYLGT